MVFILMLFVGCVKQPCPPEDLYYVHYHYDDEMPIPIPLFMLKGFFDTEDCCKTPEEYEEYVKELKIYIQKQRELEYQRRFGD